MRAHVNRTGLGRVSTWLMVGLALAVIAGGTAIDLAARQNAPAALDMANKGKVTVQIVAATPGLTIELALNGGKIADTPIATDGTGNSIFDVAHLGKTQAQVWIERCDNGKRVRVLIYTSGGQPPGDKDCDRKAVGFFWTDRATRIVINVRSSSMSVNNAGGITTTKVAIVTGTTAAVIFGVAQAGGGSTPGSSTPIATVPVVTTPANATVAVPTPVTPPATSVPAPAPSTPPFAFLVNRTYNNMVTRGRADCAGFAAGASTQLRFTNIDPQTGMGSFVHVHSGTTMLNYNVQSAQKSGDTNATLVGTGSVTFGTTAFQLRITIVITGNTDSKTEEFNCGSGQMTVYTGTGSVAP